jgi:hypothetical protein
LFSHVERDNLELQVIDHLRLLHHGGVAGEVARQDLRELGPHLLN